MTPHQKPTERLGWGDLIERGAWQDERARCLAAVDAEEEMEGDMPIELYFQLITMSRGSLEDALRLLVRRTKNNIRERINGNA